MKVFISKVANGLSLSESEAEEAFGIIMSGDATPSQMGAFLMGLRLRGETIEEITGAARAMRKKSKKIKAPKDALDIVGTGGDSTGTFNISTGSTLVAAGAGVTIAKHGNRAISSKSGSADVLSELGVNTDAEFSVIEKAIQKCGVGFMMAPRHHSAMRHVAGTRVELATRTLFNVLGPLSNPAGVTRQLTGVYSENLVEPIAQALKNLGITKTWVVCGSDGMDELTTTGVSYVASLDKGNIDKFEITPKDAGLPEAKLSELKGGDSKINAIAIKEMLGGKLTPYRNIVLLNSAATLIVAEKTNNLKEGIKMAEESIDSGRASRVLECLVTITNS